MQASAVPTSFPAVWGNSAGSGFIRAIPTASQIGSQNGAASLADGFPPNTFIQEAAGGVPPFGQDTNGILNQITAGVQWTQVGGEPTYSSAFSTAIGGYPNGAILQSEDGTGFWRSTVDNNTSDPDTGGANWLPMFFGTSATVALTNANVTLSAVQYSKPLIILSGTLTGNVVLTFPMITQTWTVINATIGAFSVSAIAGGSAVVLVQGYSSSLRGNGSGVFIDKIQTGAVASGSGNLTLASNALINCTNLSGSAQVPLQCGLPTSAAEVVLLGQFLSTIGSGNAAISIPTMIGGVLKTLIFQVGSVSLTAASGGTTNEAFNLTVPYTTTHIWAISSFGGNAPPANGSPAAAPFSLTQVEISLVTQNAGSFAIQYASIGY